MRKYLRYMDGIVMLCGAAGMLLRLWLLLAGPDAKGLYPAHHPAWILLCVFSVLTAVFIWLMTRHTGNNRSYRSNFPPSVLGAAGSAIAAVGLAVAGFTTLSDGDLLSMLAGILGLLSAAGLLLAAWNRYRGQRVHFVCHMLPCLFFAAYMFLMGRELGSEPETQRYLFRFFATIAMVPACYQLWAFDVNQGDRQKSLFWSLTAAYLCLVAMPGSTQWPMYLTAAIWLLTGLPVLKYLPKRKRAEAPTEAEPQTEHVEEPTPAPTQEPAPQPEQPLPESLEAPAAQPAEESSDTPAELDPDEIIAEILRQIDSNIQ